MKNKQLLTPAEKAWLKEVIKPYIRWVVSITKTKMLDIETTYSYAILIRFGSSHLSPLLLPIDRLSNWYQFKGLELGTIYDLTILGL